MHPYAAISATQEENPFRRPDSEPASKDSERHVTLKAGVEGELRFSRQRLLLDADLYRTAYRDNNRFDHTGGELELAWRWLVGRLWDGELSYRYDRKLRSFANQLQPERDMRDRHRLVAAADRQLSQRWRLELGSAVEEIAFSQSRELNKRKVGAEAALAYVSGAGNRVALEARYLDAQFTAGTERDYQQVEIGPELEWRPTGKLRVEAAAAYVRRQNEDAALEDFDGAIGRLEVGWQMTGKTALTASGWREVGNLQDEVRQHAVIEGAALRLRWTPTAATVLYVQVAEEEREFQEANGAFSGRDDRLTSREIGFDWRPRRRVSLSMAAGYQARDSDYVLREYEANYTQLRLIGRF